jgi:hypothetical protein
MNEKFKKFSFNLIIILILILAFKLAVLFSRGWHYQKCMGEIFKASGVKITNLRCGEKWSWTYGYCKFEAEKGEMEKLAENYQLRKCSESQQPSAGGEKENSCSRLIVSEYCGDFNKTEIYTRGSRESDWSWIFYNEGTKEACMHVYCRP